MEFSLIHKYFAPLTASSPNTHLGIGDDCAISQIPPQHQLVSCVDTLVAGRHFPLHTSAHAIGWKSVAVNLSDLAAMGATPYAILLALSLPQVDESWLQGFSQGLAECCQKYHLDLIGGDTTQSPQLTISVTALGWLPIGTAITRAGAHVGDYICVSGCLGDASFALQAILEQQPTPVQHALDYPQPQVTLGQKLLGYASAMIDISDGLIQDLSHILHASQVGATIYLDQLPTSTALATLSQSQQWQHQLAGGDDYQLCFCISPQHYQTFVQHHQIQPAIIGKITSLDQQASPLKFTYHGQDYDASILQLKGYQHFDTIT